MLDFQLQVANPIRSYYMHVHVWIFIILAGVERLPLSITVTTPFSDTHMYGCHTPAISLSLLRVLRIYTRLMSTHMTVFDAM
jgi:hypothetical protein